MKAVRVLHWDANVIERRVTHLAGFALLLACTKSQVGIPLGAVLQLLVFIPLIVYGWPLLPVLRDLRLGKRKLITGLKPLRKDAEK